MTLDVQKCLYNSEFLIESEARIVGIAIAPNALISHHQFAHSTLIRMGVLLAIPLLRYSILRIRTGTRWAVSHNARANRSTSCTLFPTSSSFRHARNTPTQKHKDMQDKHAAHQTVVFASGSFFFSFSFLFPFHLHLPFIHWWSKWCQNLDLTNSQCLVGRLTWGLRAQFQISNAIFVSITW